MRRLLWTFVEPGDLNPAIGSAEDARNQRKLVDHSRRTEGGGFSTLCGQLCFTAGCFRKRVLLIVRVDRDTSLRNGYWDQGDFDDRQGIGGNFRGARDISRQTCGDMKQSRGSAPFRMPRPCASVIAEHTTLESEAALWPSMAARLMAGHPDQMLVPAKPLIERADRVQGRTLNCQQNQADKPCLPVRPSGGS